MDTQKAPMDEFGKTEEGQPVGLAAAKKPSAVRRAIRRIGWLAGGPGDWLGRKSVGSGAALIGILWKRTRTGPQRDSRFKLDQGGAFDLKATAFSYGISVEVLEQRLEKRRSMTVLVSYGALFIAVIGMIFWVHSAIDQPYTLVRVVMAWEFLPFISLFSLLAFYYALLNFQIRVRRSAGWREFLSTEEGFLPR
jgi:hypothetical protein